MYVHMYNATTWIHTMSFGDMFKIGLELDRVFVHYDVFEA